MKGIWDALIGHFDESVGKDFGLETFFIWKKNGQLKEYEKIQIFNKGTHNGSSRIEVAGWLSGLSWCFYKMASLVFDWIWLFCKGGLIMFLIRFDKADRPFIIAMI